MKSSVVLPLALVAVMSAAATHAQTFSTNFDNPADRDGSFSSVTLGGVAPGYLTLPVGSYPGDAYALVNDNFNLTAASATFSFSTVAPTAFFLVDFAALDIGSTTLNVTLSNGTQTLTQGFGPGSSPLIPLVQPNAPGDSYSYYFGFGSTGTQWTPGSYTLTFRNGGAPNSFALDDVSVQAVPEPSSYAMMLAALGALGYAARRRKAVE